jgi:serine/threonine-protein kinase
LSASARTGGAWREKNFVSDRVPSVLSPGMVFHGRYQILRCLKAGGMGAVYECVHLKTRKHRALKVMLPQVVADAAMRARFELEARVTAEIESDHIVETFDAGIDDETGAPFLVMELLRGSDLAGIIEKKGPLSPPETVLLLHQAALALDKTHAAGIVHRDLKPENLFLVSTDDGSPRLKILDFGIAKVIADGTQTNRQTAAIGTPLYMSPEQVRGDGRIGPPADVYSLGHIAFTLLTGRAYWDEEQTAMPSIFSFLSEMMRGVIEPPTARAARWGRALPPSFDGWFACATATSPTDRFERASALVAALASVVGVEAPRSKASALAGASSGPAVGPAVAAQTPPTPYWLQNGTPASAPFPDSPPGATPGSLPQGFPAHGTMGAVSNESRPGRPSRSSAPLVVMLAVAVSTATAAGLYSWRRARTVPDPAEAQPVAVAPTATPSTAVAAPPVATVTPASDSERVARVVVGPAGVSVEIDDRAIEVENGSVAVRGAPGSVHRIAVRKDGRTTTGTFVLSDAGPVPSAFELAPAASSAVHASGAGGPAHAVDPPVRPTATSPGVKPATPNDPAVSRKFE